MIIDYIKRLFYSDNILDYIRLEEITECLYEGIKLDRDEAIICLLQLKLSSRKKLTYTPIHHDIILKDKHENYCNVFISDNGYLVSIDKLSWYSVEYDPITSNGKVFPVITDIFLYIRDVLLS